MAARREPEPADPSMMRYWISRTLGDRREAAGIGIETIRTFIPGNARDGRIDRSVLTRFEQHKTWPQQLDQIVPAYALVLGMDDPRDLWEEAAERYVHEGVIPRVAEPTPQLLSALAALEAARRRQQRDDESSSKPTSKHSRRASGE